MEKTNPDKISIEQLSDTFRELERLFADLNKKSLKLAKKDIKKKKT